MVTKVITENAAGGDFAGESDAFMDEAAPTSSGNAKIETLSSSGASRNRSLLKFTGLSNIPANATIVSASLQLYVELVDGDCTPELILALRNWSSPTWNQYSAGNNWTTAGCSGIFTDRSNVQTAVASVVAASAGSYVTWSGVQIGSDVSNWVQNIIPNLGWLLQNTSDTTAPGTGAVFGHALGTDGHRPILTVNYTVPSVDQQMTSDLYF